MSLTKNGDLLTLRDHCRSVIAQAEANEKRLKDILGVAEILVHAPSVLRQTADKFCPATAGLISLWEK